MSSAVRLFSVVYNFLVRRFQLDGYLPSNIRLNYSRIHATFSNFKHCQISGSGALQLPDTRYLANCYIVCRIPDARPDIRASLVLVVFSCLAIKFCGVINPVESEKHLFLHEYTNCNNI